MAMESRSRARAIAGLALALMGACSLQPASLWAHEAQGATDITVMRIDTKDGAPSKKLGDAPQPARPLDQTGNDYHPPLLLAGSLACAVAVIVLRKKRSAQDGRGRPR